jgi:hypothetical protein
MGLLDDDEAGVPAGDQLPYEVVPLRATGVSPEAVALDLERELVARAGSHELERVVPIIYNSSTTGYLLLVFRRR